MNKEIEITDMYTYVADKHDTFDLIAYREYGNELLADFLIKQNLDYADVLVFEGGEELNLPEINIREIDDSLPPWRKGKAYEESEE